MMKLSEVNVQLSESGLYVIFMPGKVCVASGCAVAACNWNQSKETSWHQHSYMT